MKPITQQFNDGVLSVYSVDNIAEDGDLPKKELKIKQGGLRYEERTVGMNRFWTAMQNNSKVEQMLRIQRINGISLQDVAIPNDGEQYDIVQIQFPKDIEPPCMDLSLQKVSAIYDIKGC
jgi:hypothetical protein